MKHLFLLFGLLLALAAIGGCTQSEQPEAEDFTIISLSKQNIYTRIINFGPQNNLLVAKPLQVPQGITIIPTHETRYLDPKGKLHTLPVDESKIFNGKILSLDGKTAIILIDKKKTAHIWFPRSGKIRKLVASAAPTFAIHQDTAKAVFMVGQMPEYKPVLVDLHLGTTKELVSRATPSWSPVFSPQGDKIIFVYSPESFPALYSVDSKGHNLTQLTQRGITAQTARTSGHQLQPFPTGNTQPVWIENSLYFSKGTDNFRLQLNNLTLEQIEFSGTLIRIPGKGIFKVEEGKTHRLDPNKFKPRRIEL
ncbi:MAG: hypothetical protein PF689_07605 [Deltaproteobacteria bacterium]|jgi:hypothetical protein|nr:hypothetical protein [Deltaproteobacteria bacterium]